MTRTEQTQAIIQDRSAREWFYSMLRAKRMTWQRDEAKTGLRAAIQTAIGFDHKIDVVEGKLARDISISIDRQSISATFYFS